jgi:acyl-CoA dehydrogenase
MTDESRIFRKTVRRFIENEIAPRHDHWAERGYPDADVWRKAGEIGLLLSDVPEEYGGAGGTYAHEAIIIEELARSGLHFGFNSQSIVAHYILRYGSEEQKQRWLPRMAAGELVGAVGFTEPQSGSDLQGITTIARRQGE